MKKNYWFIILTYMVMQFSGIFGIELFEYLRIGESRAEYIANWTIVSFTLALIITLYLLRNERTDGNSLRGGEPSSILISSLWAFGGIFLALFSQVIAANIEIALFGVEPGSENTQNIVKLIQASPLVIIVTSIIGPILEEIIFRKIIFGGLYNRTNFFIAAIISSLLFSLLHGEFEHLLLYAAMGFTFAFLYVRTKRIIVPIIAHVSMNTLVVVTQVLFKDKIEEYLERLEQMEQLQVIIGGILL
ncbi:CPBP family intramembrane glutamic endopeptidase [Metabacillus malikii]|uniref:Membrane protease YdiL (CAAX protease family) n=1 Tax=Metabacillus malikii TaxID=1504265 RepID=A0ABT9ZKQ3_9BACI|nr:type II CAAX endopeptidase family protein [Metabacillus malikii]MDQ0232859.1 membrane protease YdiL (CAAX protease family) [Metabacillus malikii]